MTSRKQCTFDECNLPISSRGLCKKHSHKLFDRKQTRCRITLCDKPAINITNELCPTHYEVFLKKIIFKRKKQDLDIQMLKMHGNGVLIIV